MKNAQSNILLVEDNEGDIELTKIAFREGNLSSQLSVVHDGAEALAFLARQGQFHDAARPDLILLDLNMPRLGGREFLDAVKQDAQFKSIPVIMLTSSNARMDITECYDRHANCYVIKPLDLTEFIDALRQIENFWIKLAQLPRLAP